MSSYGPPNGPYRGPSDPYGQPADPWGDQESWGGDPSSAPPPRPGPRDPGYGDQGYGDQGYGSQSYGDRGYPDRPYPDPSYGDRGYADQGYADQGYSDRGYRQQGYDQTDGYQQPTAPNRAPEWNQPAPPPRRGRGGAAIAVIAVLAVLVLGGGAAALYLITKGQGDGDTGQLASGASAGPTTSRPRGGGATPGGTAQPHSSTEGRFAAKGQCISNDGTDETPKIRVVKCSPNTFEVLARFDNTIDYKGKCAGVPGYQYHYFFDSQLDALDFVLCMKKR